MGSRTRRDGYGHELARLDRGALVRLLRARPEARAKPVPADFGALARRLTSEDSLRMTISGLTMDGFLIGAALAALGGTVAVSVLADVLAVDEATVRTALASMTGPGLVRSGDGPQPSMPPVVRDFWVRYEFGGHYLDRVEHAAVPGRVAEIVALPPALRTALEQARDAWSDEEPTPPPGLLRELRDRRLIELNYYGEPDLPRTTALALRLLEMREQLADAPALPPPSTSADAARSGAEAAAGDLLAAATALADRAAARPLVPLRKSGVGIRERTKASAELSIPLPTLNLCLVLLYVTGLFGQNGEGYSPSAAFEQWREQDPGRQWAVLADAWLHLGYAPTWRKDAEEGGREIPPPLPVPGQSSWWRRRVLLGCATGGAPIGTGGPGISMGAVVAHSGWFYPVQRYEDDVRAELVGAAVREAELLGVVVGDRVSPLGAHLLAGLDTSEDGRVDALADAVAGLLPPQPCTLILQSDLTAVVSGRPSAALARLLNSTAIAEARGVASVWRFTPESLRVALDAGRDPADILAELSAASGTDVPQALEYLVNDTARRHGHVRVRAVACCVIADEALAGELLHTRSLAKLELSRLAPTVLASPSQPREVLAQLRAAGFAPQAEDMTGTVIVEARTPHRSVGYAHRLGRAGVRAVTTAEDLADALLAQPAADPAATEPEPLGPDAASPIDGSDGSGSPGDVSPRDIADMASRLRAAGAGLSDLELTLLARAVVARLDLLITYRQTDDVRAERLIRPHQFIVSTILAYCYQHETTAPFAVNRIEAVHLDG